MIQPFPLNEKISRIHARIAILKARILKANIINRPSDKARNYLREDWEGVDCQVCFNDPEDADSHTTEDTRELLFESELAWLEEEHRVAASRSIFVQGPTCMSTMKYSHSDDSDSGGDDDSSDGDPQELAQGLWLCDT